LVVRGPGFEGGVADEMASLVDIPATILHAAGLDVPTDWHGRPLQRRQSGDWRQQHMVQISESQIGRALRTDRWTYSVRVPGAPWKKTKSKPPMDASTYVEDFLYDNEADPHQLNNLAVDPAFESIRAELREELLGELRAIGEPPAAIVPAPSDGPDLQVAGAAASAEESA
jgi:arylsulfatase A-like enzyme